MTSVGVASDTTHAPVAVVSVTKHLSRSQDFAAGCVAGIVSTAVGHPFDTIKVRVQLNTVGLAMTPMQVARWTVKREGFLSLYKGLASPMLSVPLVNAIVFAAYGQAKEALQSRHPESELTAFESCVAGAYAGLVNTAVVTPIELVKCRMQVYQSDITGVRAELRTLGEELRFVLRVDGPRGLWRGNSITVCREVCSYVGLFGAYELMKTLAPEGKVVPFGPASALLR
jgi:hypothetical protein